MCWTKGHLVILFTVVRIIGFSFGRLGNFPLEGDWSVPGGAWVVSACGLSWRQVWP